MMKQRGILFTGKKLLFVLTILGVVLFSTGCATWEGVKQDTNDAYDATKEAIHKATE